MLQHLDAADSSFCDRNGANLSLEHLWNGTSVESSIIRRSLDNDWIDYERENLPGVPNRRIRIFLLLFLQSVAVLFSNKIRMRSSLALFPIVVICTFLLSGAGNELGLARVPASIQTAMATISTMLSCLPMFVMVLCFARATHGPKRRTCRHFLQHPEHTNRNGVLEGYSGEQAFMLSTFMRIPSKRRAQRGLCTVEQ